MECPIGSRVDRRRARNRARILDEAERLFAEQTFTDVRIDRIAAAADVSVGTVYNYFGDKDGVYLAVTERVLDRVEEHLRPAYDPELPPVEAIELLGRRYLQALAENPIACRSLVSDALTPGGEVAEAVGARITGLYSAFAALIDRAAAAGLIEPIHGERAARFLIGAWNGVFATTFQTLAPPADLTEVERILELGAGLLLRGATRPPDAPGAASGR